MATSGELKAQLKADKEYARPRKRLERGGAIGAVCLEGYGIGDLAFTNGNTGSVLAIVTGIGIGAAVVLSKLNRGVCHGELQDQIKVAERQEGLARLLPVTKPPHDVYDSITSMKLEARRASAGTGAETSLSTFGRSHGLSRLLRGYEMSSYYGEQAGIAGMAIQALHGYADSLEKPDWETRGETVAAMFGALDEYFPIDQEQDTITPVEAGTDTRSWRNYITVLYRDASRQTELAQLVNYPLEILPAYTGFQATQ